METMNVQEATEKHQSATDMYYYAFYLLRSISSDYVKGIISKRLPFKLCEYGRS